MGFNDILKLLEEGYNKEPKNVLEIWFKDIMPHILTTLREMIKSSTSINDDNISVIQTCLNTCLQRKKCEYINHTYHAIHTCLLSLPQNKNEFRKWQAMWLYALMEAANFMIKKGIWISDKKTPKKFQNFVKSFMNMFNNQSKFSKSIPENIELLSPLDMNTEFWSDLFIKLSGKERQDENKKRFTVCFPTAAIGDCQSTVFQFIIEPISPQEEGRPQVFYDPSHILYRPMKKDFWQSIEETFHIWLCESENCEFRSSVRVRITPKRNADRREASLVPLTGKSATCAFWLALVACKKNLPPDPDIAVSFVIENGGGKKTIRSAEGIDEKMDACERAGIKKLIVWEENPSL